MQEIQHGITATEGTQLETTPTIFRLQTLLIHVIFGIRRVFACMELSSKLELIYIYILYN